MMTMQMSEFKKRLMFLKGEDLYFIAYNTIVLLEVFSCKSQNSPLLDHTKIAFLIEFIADSRLASIINTQRERKNGLGDSDKRQLQAAYTQGLMRRHIIFRLVFALERKGILSLESKPDTGLVAVWLNTQKLPVGFFKTELYEDEFQNAAAIKNMIPRLRTIALDTLICKLFSDNGVHVWDV